MCIYLFIFFYKKVYFDFKVSGTCCLYLLAAIASNYQLMKWQPATALYYITGVAVKIELLLCKMTDSPQMSLGKHIYIKYGSFPSCYMDVYAYFIMSYYGLIRCKNSSVRNLR